MVQETNGSHYTTGKCLVRAMDDGEKYRESIVFGKYLGGGKQVVNGDQMKEYAVDQYAGVHVPLYYWRGWHYDNQLTLGKSQVGRITANKVIVDGVLLLVTEWKGGGWSTWEPI